MWEQRTAMSAGMMKRRRNVMAGRQQEMQRTAVRDEKCSGPAPRCGRYACGGGWWGLERMWERAGVWCLLSRPLSSRRCDGFAPLCLLRSWLSLRLPPSAPRVLSSLSGTPPPRVLLPLPPLRPRACRGRSRPRAGHRTRADSGESVRRMPAAAPFCRLAMVLASAAHSQRIARRFHVHPALRDRDARKHWSTLSATIGTDLQEISAWPTSWRMVCESIASAGVGGNCALDLAVTQTHSGWISHCPEKELDKSSTQHFFVCVFFVKIGPSDKSGKGPEGAQNREKCFASPPRLLVEKCWTVLGHLLAVSAPFLG